MQSHSVLFGEKEIRFSLNYVDRKTLAIHVYPDGRVSVDAPLSADIEKVYGKVKKRAAGFSSNNGNLKAIRLRFLNDAMFPVKRTAI